MPMEFQTLLEPSDVNAEKRLVGSLILNPALIYDACLHVRPEHFWHEGYREIYKTLVDLSLSGKPVSIDTVGNKTGDVKLAAEATWETDPAEVPFWTEVVIRKSEERDLLNFLEDARASVIKNSGPVNILRNDLEARILELGSGGRGSNSFAASEVAGELEARLSQYIEHPDTITGLESGWNKLDTALDGFQSGNVSIVYAPSSRFKSLWTTNLGWRFAKKGIPGLWFTTEMPKIQVMERVLQLESKINLRWARRDKTIKEFAVQLFKAKDRIKTYPIYFCDTSALDVGEVRGEVMRHKRWHNIQYVIIDLVDHIFSSRFRDELVNNQRAVMAAMKQIAKDCDVHIILVSHVNKMASQDNNNPDLDMEAMTGSAAKYQDVDTAISLMPVYQNADGGLLALNRQQILYLVNTTGVLDILVSVTKNRHGELLQHVMNLDLNLGGVITSPDEKTPLVQFANEVLTRSPDIP